jgi:hypothetical protein
MNIRGATNQEIKITMLSSRMLCHVALVRTHVSEECTAFIIRVTRISEVGMLAVTSNRSGSNTHGIISHKMAFFTVTTMKTSKLIQK